MHDESSLQCLGVVCRGRGRAGVATVTALFQIARESLSEFRQQDDYLLSPDAPLMSEDSYQVIHIDTLQRIVDAIEAAIRQKLDGAAAVTAPIRLGELLKQLEGYGKPIIGNTGDGWYCSVEIYSPAKGVDFKVRSEFGFRAAIEAAQQCCDRLRDTLKTVHEGQQRAIK